MDVWSTVSAERLRLADLLHGLTPQQWSTPSLCGQWSVREVAAHLGAPHRPARQVLPAFARDLLRARGSFERANVIGTAREAQAPTEEITAQLRRAARSRFVPPTMPPQSQVAEVLVHGQDIRVPLGVDEPGDPQGWGTALEFLLSRAAVRGFVPAGRPELTWQATDLEHRFGPGAPSGLVTGPVAALGMAAVGRSAWLDRLAGPGLPALEHWLRRVG